MPKSRNGLVDEASAEAFANALKAQIFKPELRQFNGQEILTKKPAIYEWDE